MSTIKTENDKPTEQPALEFSENGKFILAEGEVVEAIQGDYFLVSLKGYNATIRAIVAGKMKANKIRVFKHDNVKVEISMADLQNLINKPSSVIGRIVFRSK